jgi:hypothetical protein
VKDFDTWKPYFVGDAKRQRDASATHWHLARNQQDKNELFIIFDCQDIDKAKSVFSEPALADLMKKAGVIDQPTLFFVEDIESSAL